MPEPIADQRELESEMRDVTPRKKARVSYRNFELYSRVELSSLGFVFQTHTITYLWSERPLFYEVLF